MFFKKCFFTVMVFSLGTKLIELLILSFSSHEFFLCTKIYLFSILFSISYFFFLWPFCKEGISLSIKYHYSLSDIFLGSFFPLRNFMPSLGFTFPLKSLCLHLILWVSTVFAIVYRSELSNCPLGILGITCLTLNLLLFSAPWLSLCVHQVR